MKKKILPVLIVLALIILVIGGVFLSKLIKKYTPSKERADYKDYYQITSDDMILIMQDGTDSTYRGKLIDGKIYLDYSFLRDCLNTHFYWDNNENILIYTTPSAIISANIGETKYTVNKDTNDFGSTIVTLDGENVFVNIDYAKQYVNFEYKYHENPNRLVITSKFETIQKATAKKNTYLRIKGGIKSAILCDISKKDTVRIVEADKKWTKVMTEDGFIGYVKSSTLSDSTSEELTSDFKEEEFKHIKKNFSICLAWDGIYSAAANNNVAKTLASAPYANVISPTWFYVNDNNGNLHDFADASYVNFCHSQKKEVWALVSNLEKKDIDTTYILTHTSVRNNLVNQIVSMAIQYNLDGINLDFESLKPEVGDSYIQFVRELSIKLRNNGIVLSIDNYVPSDYTAFYKRKEQANFADYIVIMGYDQHYGGSKEAGSVAALDWVKEGCENTLKDVPADQVILAMPFYTRLWCSTPHGDEGSDITYTVTSQIMTMIESIRFIQNKGIEKTWLSDAGQFYATYEEKGNKYEIWMEDAGSIGEKLNVMKDFNLAGCAFWRLGFEESSVWDTVAKYFN